MGHIPPGYLFQITGGKDHGKFASYRYDKDRTEHRQAAEAGRIVGKGLQDILGLPHRRPYTSGSKVLPCRQ